MWHAGNLRNRRLCHRNIVAREQELFAVDVNERSLSAQLAIHLQHRFPKWHVDCEYNRLGNGIKRLPLPEETRTDDRQGRTIYPISSSIDGASVPNCWSLR